jgi:hypothetical protein
LDITLRSRHLRALVAIMVRHPEAAERARSGFVEEFRAAFPAAEIRAAFLQEMRRLGIGAPAEGGANRRRTRRSNSVHRKRKTRGNRR